MAIHRLYTQKHSIDPWFEYMSRCTECEARFSDSELTHYVQMGWSKQFPVCPRCGNHRITARPDPHVSSCLVGSAVHKGCGVWHPRDTPCGLSKEEYYKMQTRELQSLRK